MTTIVGTGRIAVTCSLRVATRQRKQAKIGSIALAGSLKAGARQRMKAWAKSAAAMQLTTRSSAAVQFKAQNIEARAGLASLPALVVDDVYFPPRTYLAASPCATIPTLSAD